MLFVVILVHWVVQVAGCDACTPNLWSVSPWAHVMHQNPACQELQLRLKEWHLFPPNGPRSNLWGPTKPHPQTQHFSIWWSMLYEQAEDTLYGGQCCMNKLRLHYMVVNAAWTSWGYTIWWSVLCEQAEDTLRGGQCCINKLRIHYVMINAAWTSWGYTTWWSILYEQAEATLRGGRCSMNKLRLHYMVINAA